MSDAAFAAQRGEYVYRSTGAVDPLPSPTAVPSTWLVRLQKGGDARSRVDWIRPSVVGQVGHSDEVVGFRCVRSR